MGQIENNICDAINILVNKAISGIQLDKTISGTIEECVDEGLRQYRVKYQDSSFLAYAQGDNKYRKNTKVYVLIPSNDITEDRIILGTVDKLGNSYINNISAEDKMTKIGPNIFRNPNQDKISLSSYYNEQVNCGFNIDEKELTFYQKEASYFIVSTDFQTNLPQEQVYGNGDYGIIITCNYYNENRKETYTRDYIIHAAEMIGQPYYFSTPSRQYKIFKLEDQLTNITVKAFVNNFPVQKSGQPKDIFISNFQFYFSEALSAEELTGAALKIIAPQGSRFTDTIDNLTLQAEIKVQGALVADTSDIKYYWFVRNLEVQQGSEKYFYLGGEYWECLNSNSSTKIDGDINFIADVYKKTIVKEKYNYSSISFKCVAVLDEYILSDIIIITNEDAAYNINLTSKYGTAFPFDNYNSTITATVEDKSNQNQDITDQCEFIWGYETEDGMLFTKELEDQTSNVLSHNPIGNRIKYITTVKRNNSIIGSAEISLLNEQQQPDYTLVLENANQVFKYNLDGVSPASETIPEKDRQLVQPLEFTLYNKLGESIGQAKNERSKILTTKWYFPAENTMLKIVDNSTTPRPGKEVTYNGKPYIEYTNNNEEQLTLYFTIENTYHKAYSNNDIILEVQYKGLIYTASTNFTITKEGELGTNGTKFIARLVPEQHSNKIEQVYVKIQGNNRVLKSWNYDNSGNIQFNNNYSGKFFIELWNGGTQPIGRYDGTNQNSTWEILPKSLDNAPIIEYKTNTVGENTYNIGTIKTNFNSLTDRAIVLQACRSDTTLSTQATQYYATYQIPVVSIPSGNYEYIITGGFQDVQYAPNGERSSYNTEPFKLICYNPNTNKEIPLINSNIKWYPSWTNQEYTGSNPVITTSYKDPETGIIKSYDTPLTPPKKLEGLLNNYIIITYNNDRIIWSLNFYFDRYSMDAINGWDGTGVEVNQDYVLAPQIGAGVKEHTDNSFTGVVIGKTFSKNDKSNSEIGLFGYNKGTRTIFLNAKDGSATFGTPNKDQGCLQIKPSSNSNKVTINTYEAKAPIWNSENRTLEGGVGGELEFRSGFSKNIFGEEVVISKGHFFIGNNFYITEQGNAYLSGTINAKNGKIGAWNINEGSLEGTNNGNTIKLDLTSNIDAPAIKGFGTTDWYIKGDGTFSLADDNLNYRNNTLTIQGNLKGDNWYINTNNTFSLAEGNVVYNGTTLTIKGNLQGETDSEWYIHKAGDFSLAGGNLKYKQNTLTVHGNLEGTGWNIKEAGTFSLANNNLKYENNTLTLQGDLIGTGWYIKEEGDASLAGGNFTFDSNGNVKINANSGSMKLSQVTVTYNNIRIQGEYAPVQTTAPFTIIDYNSDCRLYPGFCFFTFTLRANEEYDQAIDLSPMPYSKIQDVYFSSYKGDEYFDTAKLWGHQYLRLNPDAKTIKKDTELSVTGSYPIDLTYYE